MFKKEIWKEKKVIKITASLFLLAVFLLFSLLGTGPEIEYEVDEEQSTDVVVQESPEMIFVDVIGCVKNPGVYQLTPGSRVFQLIELAGGLTEDAEVKSINRAAMLSDEQVLTVLSVEEYAEMMERSNGTGFVDGKVDLNSADAKALESLSGIGPAMAQKIIEYRTTHGRFTKTEDLMKVAGIGEKTYQRLKDNICVQ
ncbi:MAG: ComEA family DNA-binding protein [Firmicutes bacterium]|nr:ComEA family DNA-binding protein [Bacillota bacterium]